MKKKNGYCSVPTNHFNVEVFKDNQSMPKHGYFLWENLRDFNTSFFSMQKAEVKALNPQLRLLLEVVYEYMERSSQTN